MQMKIKTGEVVVDRHNSHLHEEVVRLLPDALLRIESKGRGFILEVVDFGRPIGETTCVKTSSEDEIIFAQRLNRFGLTRFVKNRMPEPCSSVVVILKKAVEGYVLITAFIGCRPEPEPWDRNATEQSVVFWNTRALIWGSEEIVQGTESNRCPW